METQCTSDWLPEEEGSGVPWGQWARLPGSLGSRRLDWGQREDGLGRKAPVSRVTLISKKEARMGFCVQWIEWGCSQGRENGGGDDGSQEKGHTTWQMPISGSH